MELKLKFFLIFLSLLNCALLEDISLEPNGEIIKPNYKGSTSFTVNLNKKISDYGKYINIILSAEDNHNPILYLAKDEQCENRIYLGLQVVDPIYTFIKTSLVYNQFYICIKPRENSDAKTYNLIIRNEPNAYIPFNGQGSYYVSFNDLIKMNFNISLNGELNANENSKVTIWAKGKSISKLTVDDSELKEYKYDNGMIYHGAFKSKSLILEVEAEIGDYVTIGSVVVTNGKTQEMKENANEMVIFNGRKSLHAYTIWTGRSRE